MPARTFLTAICLVTLCACGGDAETPAAISTATAEPTTTPAGTTEPTAKPASTPSPKPTSAPAAPTCQETTLLTDGFEQETTGADGVSENHKAFANWTVVGGGVDVADPSNRFVKVPSKVVDLDGSNQTKPGAIQTKKQFEAAPAGCVAIVDITAGGNGRNGSSDTFEVRYGDRSVREVTVAGNAPFSLHSFKLPSAASAVTIAQTNPTGDQAGVLVDKVVVRYASA